MNLSLNNRLTEKQLRVAFLVTRGMRNKEIADQLSTTEQVIKNYMRDIFNELGFDSRVELAMYVTKQQFIAEQTNASILPKLPRPRGTNATAKAN